MNTVTDAGRPLVSIITPTYNHAPFIKECIDSVKKQSYSNWEQIIIDDGSTDDTLSIAQMEAVNDSRIRILTQENIGIFRLGETYNKALRVSSGKYIAILEGDDFWETNKLEKQVFEMERNSAAVMSWGRSATVTALTNERSTAYPDIQSAKARFYDNKPTGSILNILFYENCIPAHAIFIRRSILEEIGGFIQNFALPLVDMPTLMELSFKGEFIFVPETLGYWRNFSQQATKTHTASISEGIYKLRNHFLTRIGNLQDGVVTINESEFRKINNAMLVKDYSRNGRYELIRKDYKKARQFYKKSLFDFGFLALDWKIRSFIGLVFSYLKMDVETLAHWFGNGKIDK